MSDTGQLPNTVYALIILWGIALPAFWHGMDLVKTPPRRWPEALFFFSLGLAVAYGGLAATGYAAPEIGRPIAKWIRPVVSDPRWAILVWFIVLAWRAGPLFVERMRGASVNALRLADQDTDIMEQRVYYTEVGVLGEPQLTGTAPFIEFHLSLVNASVFEIVWEPWIEGRISVDGEIQERRLEMRADQALRTARASWGGFVMRQWLTPAVVNKMQQQATTRFNLGGVAPQFSITHRRKAWIISKPIAHSDNVVVWHNPEKVREELMEIVSARPRD